MTFNPDIYVIDDAKFADQIGPDSLPSQPMTAMIHPLDVGTIDFRHMAPFQWIYGRSSLRGMVSAVCGSGGSVKTSLEIAKAMSVAVGRSLLSDDEEDKAHKVYIQGNVLYWNTEDPEDVMKKRIYAEMKHRGVTQEELAGRFFILSSAEGNQLRVSELGTDGKIVPANTQDLIDLCLSLNIALFVADPLVNTHSLKENDNDHQNAVIARFRDIAQQANCAVVLVHHFRKGGEAGDGESGRGAVAIHAGCRVMETVVTMKTTEAEALGLPPGDRKLYVRVDGAKANLSRGSTAIQWYKFVSVSLGNGNATYPDGDEIGVLERWTPQSAMFGVSWDDLEQVLDEIDAGVDGEYYSKTPQATMYVGKLLITHFGWDDKKTSAQVKEWLETGLLVVDSYKSPADYRKHNRVVSTPAGRTNAKQRMEARA
jgi:hypothetical protein